MRAQDTYHWAMRRTPRFLVTLAACLFLTAGSWGTERSLARSAPSDSFVTVFVQPGAHLAPVLSLIRQARRSIRLEVYLLTSRTVAETLGTAERRGVDVRVLLEERPFGGGRYAALGYRLLQDAGVRVRWANEGAFRYTHEKAMVVDGRTAGIFTFNLTSSGIYSNREFGVIDSDPADARTLTSIFDADWSRRRIGVSSPRLVISPNNARSDLQRIIDGARRTLDVYAEEVADGSIEAHLASARHRRVRVRLITSSDSPGVETLRRSGIAVAIMPQPYVHAKAMVADGREVFVGSENLSSTSLDDNREAGIMLNDRGLAGVVERTFAGDWRGSATQSSSPVVTAPSGSHAFAVQVSAEPGSVSRGQELTIRAQTDPGASCSIQVTYPDGYTSHASSLARVETAGSDGSVSWSWRVGSTVTGTAHAIVSCSLGGRSSTGNTTFVISGP